MVQSLEFARAFLRGEIEPFDEPVEDCQAFIRLYKADPYRHNDLEAAVMGLAHGDCHILTLALAEALEAEEILLLRDSAGMAVHSGLYNADRDLLLDANGVHRVTDAQAFWGKLAREKLTAEPLETGRLRFFVNPDQDEVELALDDFELIVDFIRSDLQAVGPEQDLSPSPA